MWIKKYNSEGEKYYVDVMTGKRKECMFADPLKNEPNQEIGRLMNDMFNPQSQKKTRKQFVNSEKAKIFVEQYLTNTGRKLLTLKQISTPEAWELYSKKRYRANPNSKPIKMIRHAS